MALFSRAPVAHLPFRLALSPPTRSRGDCRTSAVSRDAPPTVTGGNVRVANGRIGVGPEERKGARNGRAGSRGAGAEAEEESGELPVLYDDGYGTASVKDFLDRAKEIARPDGGPPRWFCPVECGKPIQGAPLLLFLPGIDGTGMGLILHHRPLGKAFEVRCLHIPVSDRTQFEGLVEFVEHTVQNEFASSPNKAIYLVGDSFGGCLALAVAARNPTIDLVLILCNPATSFNKSQLQPLFPVLKVIPNELHVTVPYLLSFVLGDPIKLAIASIDDGISPSETLDQLSRSLTSLLPRLSDLADIIPKESLLWKLKLLNSAASYANSRLHAVKADVLVLYSGKDNMLPSEGEGKRLWTSLKNCRVRKFKDNGHALLLEGGINLMTIIKATNLYRRSRKLDYITDSLPPSLSEFRETFEKNERWFRQTTSPVILSTLRNGEIVRGLSGVPDKGPVLFVGNHMLMGLELAPLYEEFVKEKRINIHGMTHPILFSRRNESSQQELSRFDLMKVFGALPVSPFNMYKLLSRKSFVLLYPGGAREALHRKGEEYKLFWPDQPEFVRMAAQFEATIVPFGVVGEDDISELVLDYNDQTKIPYLRQQIMEFNQNLERLRTDADGEVSEQDIHFPICLPKIPGRFYYLFGKPIETKGLKESIKDRKNANQLYLQIKSNVENILQYLKKKREEDPYRDLLSRAVYQASWGSTDDAPSFDP